MSLANLIKKGSLRRLATATPATFATVSPNIPPSVATVATVAVANAPDSASVRKNDGVSASSIGHAGTIRPAGLSPKLLGASLALDAEITAHGAPGPASYCWPHSTAMNTVEIDIFTARMARFAEQRLILAEAERMADRLVIRDRENDDRAVCLECVHLQPGGRCGNWQRAGVAIRSRDAQLAKEFMQLLQRCDGFAHSLHF